MALATLLAMQAAQKKHVGTLAEKRRLNLFEAAIQMKEGEKPPRPGTHWKS